MTEPAHLTRDDARRLFSESGLTYADVLTSASVADLVRRIDAKLEAADLMPAPGTGKSSYRMRKLKRIVRNGPSGIWADLRCKAFYFKDRQAVTFEPSGFIGFAGWASDENVAPILNAFAEWVASKQPSAALAA